jgi:hypothetical protein
MYIFIWRVVYVTKNLSILKKYMLLVPWSCILYCDFNVNNIFKCILYSSSVKMYYFTGNSGSHFFKILELYSIFSYTFYQLQ